MTPNEFQRSYKDLSVDTAAPDGTPFATSGIECRHYLINYAGNRMRQQAGLALHRVRTAVSRFNHTPPGRGRPIVIDAGAFSVVEVGKGAPWEMEHVLECGIAAGAINPDRQALQVFANECFGVDCTGFVSAYFRDFGFMNRRDAVGAGCGYFFDQARHRHYPIIWDIAEVRQADVFVWMRENRTETKSPGHIALIDNVTTGGVLNCVESSGGAGRDDPRATQRNWGEVQGPRGQRYLELRELSGGRPHVIVIRPFNTYGAPSTAIA